MLLLKMRHLKEKNLWLQETLGGIGHTDPEATNQPVFDELHYVGNNKNKCNPMASDIT